MLNRAIRLATWPVRTAASVTQEALWLARAAAEVYGYGITVGSAEDEGYDWPLTDAGNFLDNDDQVR